jgi:hypothetical protein
LADCIVHASAPHRLICAALPVPPAFCACRRRICARGGAAANVSPLTEKDRDPTLVE